VAAECAIAVAFNAHLAAVVFAYQPVGPPSVIG